MVRSLSFSDFNFFFLEFYDAYTGCKNYKKLINDSINEYIRQNPKSEEIEISKLSGLSDIYLTEKKMVHKMLVRLGYEVKSKGKPRRYYIQNSIGMM